jgi:taurine--2-oxoglutarate transaminase
MRMSKTQHTVLEATTDAEISRIISQNLDHTLFSWSPQKGLSPLLIDRAEGIYLYEASGRRILDFSSGLMNVNIGHGNPRIADAVQRQMAKVSYVTPSCATRVRGELGERLAGLFPGDLNTTFFTVCGATSIESAIKLARAYTGRHKVLCRYQSYHGSTYGAMSAGGDPRKQASDGQQAPNFVHFDLPIAYRWPFDEPSHLREALASLERILAYEGPRNVAAILLEGESGSSGCLKYPPGFLKAVRALCDQHGILLIIDEVMSGFGRTGRWFGFQHHGIIPDMVTMAKGLTSGYLPLGGIMVSQRVARHFDDIPLPIGLTYSAHPVACAAACETLQVYEDEGLVERAAAMGHYLDARMESLRDRHPSVGDWRNTGLLGCLELVRNRQTREPMAPFNATSAQMGAMAKVAARLRELGMHTFVRWSYVFIAPPLIITEEQLDEGLAMLSDALRLADAEVEA